MALSCGAYGGRKFKAFSEEIFVIGGGEFQQSIKELSGRRCGLAQRDAPQHALARTRKKLRLTLQQAAELTAAGTVRFRVMSVEKRRSSLHQITRHPRSAKAASPSRILSVWPVDNFRPPINILTTQGSQARSPSRIVTLACGGTVRTERKVRLRPFSVLVTDVRDFMNFDGGAFSNLWIEECRVLAAHKAIKKPRISAVIWTITDSVERVIDPEVFNLNNTYASSC